MKSTKSVLVIGTFDVLHYGHLMFLRECAELGFVSIALGSDAWQESYKRTPIQTYWERLAALRMLGRDFRIGEIYRRETPSTRNICGWANPDYLPYGSDWTLEGYLDINGLDMEYCDKNHITPIRLLRDHDMSTSEIIRRIKEREGA